MVKDHAGPPPLRRSSASHTSTVGVHTGRRSRAEMPEPEDLPFHSYLPKEFLVETVLRTDETRAQGNSTTGRVLSRRAFLCHEKGFFCGETIFFRRKNYDKV